MDANGHITVIDFTRVGDKEDELDVPKTQCVGNAAAQSLKAYVVY